MLLALALLMLPQETPRTPVIDVSDLRTAVAVIGLEWSDEKLELMLDEVRGNLAAYAAMRTEEVPNELAPALVFTPLLPGMTPSTGGLEPVAVELPDVRRPDDPSELAWADIPTLAALIHSRQVSCVELAEIFLARMRRLDAELHCVITYTEERALAQAAALDQELEEGRWRGLLHGIPWGAKDLLAVEGHPTTWGATPFTEQVLEGSAEVVRRLDAAGAVLLAKLSLGALAMGDVWFGERTRNPWNTRQGSSGSSAGPAAAVAAGCVPFAIGSETYGSIVSPSARCGVTSLRPTFGRVPRTGAMTLSWSMDKLGPMARNVTDLGLVFDALQGPDGVDSGCIDAAWALPGRASVEGLRVGFVESQFALESPDRVVLEQLEALGLILVPIELPERSLEPLLLNLFVECATAFDDLTRDGRDDLLRRQGANAWPNLFRSARLVPAVEYLRANRLRTVLMREVEAALSEVDLYVHPTFGGNDLTIGNLTGLPTVVLPSGFRPNGTPRSICFTGRLFGEARLLATAGAWQASTEHQLRHPDL